eukprot:scaffold42271_cov33-Attheya_sp.AAC.6
MNGENWQPNQQPISKLSTPILSNQQPIHLSRLTAALLGCRWIRVICTQKLDLKVADDLIGHSPDMQ